MSRAKSIGTRGFLVGAMHHGWLRASSKFDEKFMKSRIYESERERGDEPARLTRDGGNGSVQAEKRKTSVGVRGTQNSPRAVVGTTRDDGIFITTRFAPGIILGTFSRELSEEARAPAKVFVRATAGNEFARRQVLPAVFFSYYTR